MKVTVIFLVTLVALILFAGPLVMKKNQQRGHSMGMMGMMGGDGGQMSMIRHHYVMRNGVPKQYSGKVNHQKNNENSINSGKKLFAQNCASCHGILGQGDGEAGKNLRPQPTNIARLSKMPMATDGYLFWAISEGGVPLQTAMPPFKKALKEEHIWNIINYLRQL